MEQNHKVAPYGGQNHPLLYGMKSVFSSKCYKHANRGHDPQQLILTLKLYFQKGINKYKHFYKPKYRI